MRSGNLVVRFLLELCALSALGYWGVHTGGTMATKIALATLAVLAAVVAWGLFVAPKARIHAGSALRWAVELAVFGAATASLVAVDRPWYAIALGMVYLMNRVLMAVWNQ